MLLTYIFVTLLTIVGSFVIMILSTNLLGGVVRGFFENPALRNLQDNMNADNTGDIRPELKEIINEDIDRQKKASHPVTLVFVLLTLLFFYGLYSLLGLIGVVAALLNMAGRLPDLLWEIRNGRKISTRDMPMGVLSIATTLILWAAFPLLWWAFYILLT